MSLHISIMIIYGTNLEDIVMAIDKSGFRVFIQKDQIIGWDNLIGITRQISISQHNETKFLVQYKEWVILLDLGMIIIDQWAFSKNISHHLNTLVVSFCAEGTSDFYGYRIFERGKQTQSMICEEGKILEYQGNLPSSEANDSSNLNEEKLLTTLKILGFDYIQFTNDINMNFIMILMIANGATND